MAAAAKLSTLDQQGSKPCIYVEVPFALGNRIAVGNFIF
jgi:hypothetical protein